MTFWIVAAALTIGVCLAVLAPLARRAGRPIDDQAHELEVYKDQLREIERDGARGMISPAEAELARAELGRRIIKVSERQSRDGTTGSSRFGRVLGTLAVLSLPLVSWGVYSATGSPGYPGQPLHARLAQDPAEASVDELIARVEAHLAANPYDARGWDVLAPIYLRLERFGDAAAAYAKAMRLDGETAARLAGQGEALVSAENGEVGDEARGLFIRAVAIEPDNPRSRYFLALSMAQAGDAEGAAAAWAAMRADLPDGSPWIGVVDAALAQGQVGPTMQAGANAEMVETMVAGLARRLESDPADVDGWQRLIRSYMVLERRDAALDALRTATIAFGAGSPEAGHLAAYGLSLGLELEN